MTDAHAFMVTHMPIHLRIQTLCDDEKNKREGKNKAETIEASFTVV